MEAAVTITGERHVALADIDPAATGSLTERQADKELRELQKELRDLHDLMMAAETHGLLVILQGMDAAGKDVTIESVFGAMNPQAFRVKSFSKPSEEEAKHHFLWRADVATPMVGEVVVFDRSYYEQAMPEDLQGDLAGDRRERRFEHINAFERILTDEGIIVIKVFLHVGKDEQERRLEERQEDLSMAWKISDDDWLKRNQWDEHMAGFEEILNACATSEAPWYVVPAEHRWYHNAVVARLVTDRLREFRPGWEDARRETGEQNQQAAREARRKTS